MSNEMMMCVLNFGTAEKKHQKRKISVLERRKDEKTIKSLNRKFCVQQGARETRNP